LVVTLRVEEAAGDEVRVDGGVTKRITEELDRMLEAEMTLQSPKPGWQPNPQ